MSDLLSVIWRPVPIAPMPLLAALRDAVLVRSTTRMPKWKFRVADDIVIRVQPKPATITKTNRDGLPWFDCFSVIHGEANSTMLKDPPRDSWQVQFRLAIFPGWVGAGDDVEDRVRSDAHCVETAWRFKVTGMGFGGGLQNDACLTVRDRLRDILPIAFERLRPEMMLKPACLMCGKMLTDPVSMARWIGPECAGTSSSAIPYTVFLTEAA